MSGAMPSMPATQLKTKQVSRTTIWRMRAAQQKVLEKERAEAGLPPPPKMSDLRTIKKKKQDMTFDRLADARVMEEYRNIARQRVSGAPCGKRVVKATVVAAGDDASTIFDEWLTSSSTKAALEKAALAVKAAEQYMAAMEDASKFVNLWAAEDEAAAAMAAAKAAAAEQAAAANRAAAAKKAKDMKRAAFLLAPTRNDGPRGFATQLKVADPADAADERICCICLEPAEDTVACCGKGMHKACLAKWLQSGGDNWPLGYGEDAAYLVGEGTVDTVPTAPTAAWLKDERLAPHIRADGRPAVTDKKVDTKTCPCCRVPTQSTLRAGLGR